MVENLISKVGEIIVTSTKRTAYEVSYYTGVGWKYDEKDEYKDFISRRIQRRQPHVSVNNLFARLSMNPLIK